MTQRTAKKAVMYWLSALLENDDTDATCMGAVSDEDHRRIQAAKLELAAEMSRRSGDSDASTLEAK